LGCEIHRANEQRQTGKQDEDLKMDERMRVRNHAVTTKQTKKIRNLSVFNNAVAVDFPRSGTQDGKATCPTRRNKRGEKYEKSQLRDGNRHMILNYKKRKKWH
jgi:hypothetical protein